MNNKSYIDRLGLYIEKIPRIDPDRVGEVLRTFRDAIGNRTKATEKGIEVVLQRLDRYEDFIVLLGYPRRLKNTLRRTWRAWEALQGEVDFMSLLIVNAIRENDVKILAPEEGKQEEEGKRLESGEKETTLLDFLMKAHQEASENAGYTIEESLLYSIEPVVEAIRNFREKLKKHAEKCGREGNLLKQLVETSYPLPSFRSSKHHIVRQHVLDLTGETDYLAVILREEPDKAEASGENGDEFGAKYEGKGWDETAREIMRGVMSKEAETFFQTLWENDEEKGESRKSGSEDGQKRFDAFLWLLERRPEKVVQWAHLWNEISDKESGVYEMCLKLMRAAIDMIRKENASVINSPVRWIPAILWGGYYISGHWNKYLPTSSMDFEPWIEANKKHLSELFATAATLQNARASMCWEAIEKLHESPDDEAFQTYPSEPWLFKAKLRALAKAAAEGKDISRGVLFPWFLVPRDPEIGSLYSEAAAAEKEACGVIARMLHDGLTEDVEGKAVRNDKVFNTFLCCVMHFHLERDKKKAFHSWLTFFYNPKTLKEQDAFPIYDEFGIMFNNHKKYKDPGQICNVIWEPVAAVRAILTVGEPAIGREKGEFFRRLRDEYMEIPELERYFPREAFGIAKEALTELERRTKEIETPKAPKASDGSEKEEEGRGAGASEESKGPETPGGPDGPGSGKPGGADGEE